MRREKQVLQLLLCLTENANFCALTAKHVHIKYLNLGEYGEVTEHCYM